MILLISVNFSENVGNNWNRWNHIVPQSTSKLFACYSGTRTIRSHYPCKKKILPDVMKLLWCLALIERGQNTSVILGPLLITQPKTASSALITSKSTFLMNIGKKLATWIKRNSIKSSFLHIWGNQSHTKLTSDGCNNSSNSHCQVTAWQSNHLPSRLRSIEESLRSILRNPLIK